MEHLYIISYDISDGKRWRRVFRTLKGYGDWVQLSVFQCRLDRMRLIRLTDSLSDIVNQKEDHVLIMDLGPADAVKPRVTSIGKAFEPLEREALII